MTASSPDFGLAPAARDILETILKNRLSSGTVLVYGSRAKGTNTARSDIDLVIKDSKLSDADLIEDIIDEIIDSDFPYLVDLQYYESIKNPALKRHIDREGKVLFQAEPD